MSLVLGGCALFAALVVLPIAAVAAPGGKCGAVPCMDFEADLTDKASLQRGAKYFSNYCMGCHGAGYVRYQRVAEDLGIPEQVMLDHFVFTDQRIGELMEISMKPAQSKVWFGAAPPDLSLSARSRSPEWLYTYLLTFYRDDTRPTGVNNLVFPNVGMPHVLLELQGLAECNPGPARDSSGNIRRNAVGEEYTDACGRLTVGDIKGSMESGEYEQVAYDLANFMEYIAEPDALDRRRVGGYVMIFLAVFFVFAWLLNREYWKDVH